MNKMMILLTKLKWNGNIFRNLKKNIRNGKRQIVTWEFLITESYTNYLKNSWNCIAVLHAEKNQRIGFVNHNFSWVSVTIFSLSGNCFSNSSSSSGSVRKASSSKKQPWMPSSPFGKSSSAMKGSKFCPSEVVMPYSCAFLNPKRW